MEDPIWLADIKKIAKTKLTENTWNYFSTGVDDEHTLSENCAAFDRLRIRPRFLRNIDQVNTSTQVLGHQIKAPICIAPTALQCMANDVGEKGTARAAHAFGTFMGVSAFSTTSYEEVAQAAPNAMLLVNLHIFNKRDLLYPLIDKAEHAGYKAIIITVDAPMVGKRRYRCSLPSHLQLANYKDMHVSRECDLSLMEQIHSIPDHSLSWDDIDWLHSVTKLPIILKGILTHEDALETLNHDVQGIIVSNHGGRQLDGVPSTIEALPEIVQAVNGKIEVYLDGGIRRGTDVFKALALGAKAVFIGRPALWGLAYDGENGVKKVLTILQEEFERTMMLTGCRDITEIKSDMVVHESHYWNIPRTKV